MSLARILKKTKGRQTFLSDSRWVLPTSFIGLEAEYEGVKNRNLPSHTYADFWQYHEEGSLKDDGAEYVFSTPLFGADAYNATAWLTAHAKDNGWKCTKRTGIHVHLDVRDLSIPQLAGLCILYAAIEPILYRWVGDGRSSSHFCIPLYRADEALLGVCSVLKAAIQDDKEEDSGLTLSASEGFQRYAGFNLQALFKFGSIEFRHLQTTHDLNRIIDWVNMIMSLKATAFKLPQSDGAVVRMLEKMLVEDLLNYIFGSDLAKKLYTEHSAREFERIGLTSSRDIAVHGCGDTSWVSGTFPIGENAGFNKWIKNNKKEPRIAPKEVEEFQILGEPVWEDAPDNVPAAPQPPPLARFNADVGVGVNVALEQEFAGMAQAAGARPRGRDAMEAMDRRYVELREMARQVYINPRPGRPRR